MNPFLADVCFGIFVLSPIGWLFMAIIIALESSLLARVLYGQWWRKRAALAALAANVVSGWLGIVVSTWLNGGWWLVVWLPWVSRHEVDPTREWRGFLAYYASAFVLSVLIEGVVEHIIFRKEFSARRIWRACLISNIASYFFATAAMYSISFGTNL